MNAFYTSNRPTQASSLMSVIALASSRDGMCLAASLSSPKVHSDSIERPAVDQTMSYGASFIVTGLLKETQGKNELGNWQQADRIENCREKLKLN